MERPRLITACQDPDAVLDPNEIPPMPQKEAAAESEKVLRQVIADGPQIRLDHHLVYHARELKGILFYYDV